MQLTIFDEIYNPPAKEMVDLNTEMIEKLLLRGSGIVGGKKRIYDYALTNPSRDKFATFLKGEYGIGGSSGFVTETYRIIRESHDSEGIFFKWSSDNGQNEQTLSWTKVADLISSMVQSGKYVQ